MTVRAKFATAAVGMVVAAMVSAPTAGAQRDNCRTSGDATTCQTNGSVSIAATPGTKAPPANRPQIPWLVYG
jgi:hypothetical protein